MQLGGVQTARHLIYSDLSTAISAENEDILVVTALLCQPCGKLRAILLIKRAEWVHERQLKLFMANLCIIFYLSTRLPIMMWTMSSMTAGLWMLIVVRMTLIVKVRECKVNGGCEIKFSSV